MSVALPSSRAKDWPSWPSPAAAKSAAASASPPPAAACASPSSWAVNRPSSSSKTPTRRRPSKGLVDAIWFNQGEVCCAGSRLLVQESVAEPFLARLRERMSTLRLGDSLDKGIDIGALIDPAQRERIAQLVDEGVAHGATLFQPRYAAARHWLLLPAHPAHRRRPQRARLPGGDLRPGPGRHDLPHAAGSRRARQQHALRPRRQPLERKFAARPGCVAPAASRQRLGELHQPLRRGQRLRRLPRERLRP